MHINDHHDSGTVLGGLRAALALPGRLLAETARRRATREGIATLLSMDDHLLRDIGVSRADVPCIVRHGRRR